MKKVLFSNPPMWTHEKGQLRQGIRAGSRWPFTRPAPYLPDRFQFGSYKPTPIFMTAAAAYAQRALGEAALVRFRDSVTRGESYQTYLRFLNEFQPDCIVIETGQMAWEHDLGLIVHIKKTRPEVRIAVCGPITATIQKTTAPGIVDAWLLGEYDKNVVRFLNGQDGMIGFEILSREELRDVPFPMFDEDCAWSYWDACPIGTTAPELQLWASRGCFAVCNFCAFPATMTNNDPLGLGGRKIRFYDPDWIERYIRHRMAVAQSRGLKISSVRFDGDTENASDKHTLAICEVMKRIGIPWSMMCRADTSSREVWQAMKDSGCFGVKIGFESGVDRIVNEVVKKNLNLKDAEETAKFLRSIGLHVHGTFMVGNITETEEESNQTIAFIQRLYAENAIDSHQLSGAAELHGTPLANTKVQDPHYVRDSDGVHKLEGMIK